jgi:hypothetical protein
MPFKWTLFIMLVLIGASVVLGIIDLKEGTGGTNPVDTIYSLVTDAKTGETKDALGIVGSFFTSGSQWVGAIIGMVLFDYTIFNTGYWVVFRLLLLAVGVTWFVLFALALTRGTSSS